VSGDIAGFTARRARKHKFYQPTQTIITEGIFPSGKIPAVKPGIESGTS